MTSPTTTTEGLRFAASRTSEEVSAFDSVESFAAGLEVEAVATPASVARPARLAFDEAQPAAETLVALANQRGAPDNVSVILVRISLSASEEPDEEKDEITLIRPLAQ